jgi:O-succinylbenzoic acid--CoA ligase
MTLCPESSPADWLRRAARDHGDQTALIHGPRTLDYSTLYGRLARLVGRYGAAGLRSRSPLAVVVGTTPPLAWATYLAIYWGCPLLPLAPTRKHALALIRELRIRQLITDVDDSLPLSPDTRRLPAQWLVQETHHPRTPASPHDIEDIQLVIATSGTTGASKGVMLSAQNLAAATTASCHRLGLEAGGMWLNCLPLCHIGGLAVILRCMRTGATVLLHDGFDPARVWRDLHTHRVTHLSLVPAMLSRLMDQGADAPPPAQLRVVLVGGGPLSGRLADRALKAHWPIHPSYGLSEASGLVATRSVKTRASRAGEVGTPLQGVEVDIVDQAARPTGGQGRIRIRGATVMAGYANPDWSRGLGLDHEGAFVSNDLGRIDGHGNLHILGRADEILIVGGENIHPHEIEAELCRCPGVEECAVGACRDDVWGHQLIALVHGTVCEPELERWCATRLPGPLRPRRYIKVGDLPRNALGKLARHRLCDWLD